MLTFFDKWHDDSIIDNYSNFEMFYICFEFTILMLRIVAFDVVFSYNSHTIYAVH